MGGFFRRLILVLTAVAFVLAAMPTSGVSAMPMPVATPCGHCPDKAPAGGDLGKMAYGALACAGAATGLAAMTTSYAPAFARLAYAPTPSPVTIGAAPAPDPFPPRPIVLG